MPGEQSITELRGFVLDWLGATLDGITMQRLIAELFTWCEERGGFVRDRAHDMLKDVLLELLSAQRVETFYTDKTVGLRHTTSGWLVWARRQQDDNVITL